MATSSLNPGTPDKCAACHSPRVKQHCLFNASSCTWAKCVACGSITAVILGEVRAIAGGKGKE